MKVSYGPRRSWSKEFELYQGGDGLIVIHRYDSIDSTNLIENWQSTPQNWAVC